MVDAATAGDRTATLLLQEIAGNALRDLTQGIKSLEIEYTPAVGLYGKQVEPSLGLRVSFAERDRTKVLSALVRFAENFNQEQVHVRTAPTKRAQVGHVYKDGSFNTPVVRFYLKAPLSPERVRQVAKAAGLEGFTATNEYLETYHIGDPKNAEDFKEFDEKIKKARASLGEDATSFDPGSSRLWAYGSGEGATHGFGDIRGKLYPPKRDQASASAKAVATRLAGFAVRGTVPAETITEPQRKKQKRIAESFEAMRLNALQDPMVKRAYEALAQEVLRQFDTLPIKVEVWTGKGQPYADKKGAISSKKMRQDVLFNNHLYIYGTDIGTFGPSSKNVLRRG